MTVHVLVTVILKLSCDSLGEDMMQHGDATILMLSVLLMMSLQILGTVFCCSRSCWILYSTNPLQNFLRKMIVASVFVLSNGGSRNKGKNDV